MSKRSTIAFYGTCAVLLSLGVIGLANSPLVAGVDTPHDQPVPTQAATHEAAPDITFGQCDKPGIRYTNKTQCVNFNGKLQPIVKNPKLTILCNNDSYDYGINDSSEKTIPDALFADWCN